MRLIQEVGTEILGGVPAKFYVLGGTEFGIKSKYLDSLKSFYGQSVQEYPKVLDVIDLFKKRSMFSRKPTLYIVRYDESFSNSLNEVIARSVKDSKILGTLVLLVEDSKSLSKIDKYLPECTVSVDPVDSRFVKKYLLSDFPDLPESVIEFVIQSHRNYGDCMNSCRSLSHLSSIALSRLTYLDVCKLFGREQSSKESKIREAILYRNSGELVNLLDAYEEDLSSLFYVYMSALLEIEKQLLSKYQSQEAKKYLKQWNLQDCYNFLDHVYFELKRSRTSKSAGLKERFYYLSYLLKFDPVPKLGGLS